MKLKFFKYQGTGNDFVMIDNMKGEITLDPGHIRQLCDRRFGVGADGVILLERDEEHAFYCNYYNSDGSQSFCGNGSRCAVHFARQLFHFENETVFRAIDGVHRATIKGNTVSIKMNDTGRARLRSGYRFLDTGSPHVVDYVKSVDTVDVENEGRKIRRLPEWQVDGVNVNFVQRINAETLRVRTYERGVEAETLSCGTGVTAVALIDAEDYQTSHRQVETRGGTLYVRFESTPEGYHDIWLEGPAIGVFEGEIQLAP